MRGGRGAIGSAVLACGLACVCARPAWPAQAAPSPRDGLIASPEPGWPQFRGPRRDGICDETGLLDRWPEAGPPLVRRIDGLGRGWSSPIIAGGRLFITG
ncbi:MAG: hypothetical protein JXP34_25340, partial [Planctomycetes bacterium]|nr:hypothetical protein [Planctomycetota bacterium]